MYTQRQVNKIFAHIPVKTLRWWGQLGLYGWVNETSDGRGIHRIYELANLYQIGIVEHLAALNIPSAEIKTIMLKYFRYGMRMTPPASHPDQVDENEWPEAKVEERMNKFLLLKKVVFGILTLPSQEDRLAGWGSTLIDDPQEASSIIAKGINATVILVNLGMIKDYIDQLLKRGE